MALIALAGSTGLEPATSDVTGRRSNQTELTPQAGVRVCFRSRALRGLVYTEVCPARNNFFEKSFNSIPISTNSELTSTERWPPAAPTGARWALGGTLGVGDQAIVGVFEAFDVVGFEQMLRVVFNFA